MNIAPQTLARQRICELRKRQTAFNGQLDQIVHRLSAPGDPATDEAPAQWAELWAAWLIAEASLVAITSGLAPPARR